MANGGTTFGQDFRGGPKSSFGGAVLFGEPQQRSFQGGFGVPSFGIDLVQGNYTGESKKTNKETEDDECVRQRHSMIYPTTDDVSYVQSCVTDFQ